MAINDKHFPIREALLVFTVEPDKSIDTEKLKNFPIEIINDYPIKQEIRFFSNILNIKKDEQIFQEEEKGIDGYLFMSKEKDKVFKATTNSFSFHKLRPYSNWPNFLCDFKLIWSNYLKIAKPKSIKRINLRYINNFEIEESKICLSDYFNTKIDIAENLPQDIFDLFLRFVIPVNDINDSYAVFTQSFKPNDKDENLLNIVFDIDINCTQPFIISNDKVWELVTDLKVKINYLFNQSITEKTRRLYVGLYNESSK